MIAEIIIDVVKHLSRNICILFKICTCFLRIWWEMYVLILYLMLQLIKILFVAIHSIILLTLMWLPEELCSKKGALNNSFEWEELLSEWY